MKKRLTKILFAVISIMAFHVPHATGGTNPDVTFVPTITHGTCLDPNGNIEYEVVISSKWKNEGSVNFIKIFDESLDPFFSTTDPSLIGTVGTAPVGVYTVSGSITALDDQGIWVSVPFTSTFWVGIETIWAEKIDMISSPNSYSAKRNASTATYGGVRSSNGIDSGDGWVEMSAVFGNASNSHVYWLIGETTPLGTFSPSNQMQYIEFYQSSGGNGIRIKYKSGGSYLFTTLSSDQNDKIRLVRSGSTLTIQKNNSSSTIFTLPTAYSGGMNITVRSLANNDGCLDVVSSFSCKSDTYAKVERKLRGVKYQVPGDLLRFYVTEEYDDQSTELDYNVYTPLDRATPVISGTQQVHSVVFGDNRYRLDVSSLTSGAYILEVINEKKEKFYLRFVKE